MRLPLPLFLAAFYTWATDNMDKKQRDDFDAQLDRMPANLEPEVIASQPEWQPEAQAASFMAMFHARGGVGLPAGSGTVDVAGSNPPEA